MEEFLVYLQLGFHHIADPAAYDHLLFVVTLCAAYEWKDWKKILLLVTAFTLGHSLTLALAALDIVRISPKWVEILIPFTILLTSLHNVWGERKTGALFSRALLTHYGLALFFGLIHGLGFSNFFRGLMGEAGGIVWPLFSFNVGIELGQAAIVFCYLALLFIVAKSSKISHREWNVFVSGAGAGIALTLILKGLTGT